MNRSNDEVLRFVAASFPSVWALEVLLTLKRERRPWSVEQLVTSLRASELVVSKSVEALIAAGLASSEPEGAVYLPVSAAVDKCVERVEHLYRTRPNAVRRQIISASTSSATAFANAFRLRGSSDD